MALPPCIGGIRPDRLELIGQCGALKQALKEAGYGERLFRNDRLQQCVSYDPAEGPFHANADLHGLLRLLLANDALAMERYGEPDSPAELMRVLLADEVIPPFKSVIIHDADNWQTFENPPA